MIRRNTWIVLVVLLAVVGYAFYLRNAKAKEALSATPTAGASPLFSPSFGAPADIKIESAEGTSVEISRDQAGKWVLKVPTAADANQASAEAAATQLGALRVVSSVDLGLDVIGLDKPAYTITVLYGANQTHKLLVGAVTPIQNGYYVQLDGGTNQVVDKSGLDSLLGLLTEPPYLATPTPVASSTPTLPAPTETSSTTPQPTAAPAGTAATSTP